MHYKNGRLAREGDIVIGTTYNMPGERVGVLLAITSVTSDKCNAILAYNLESISIGFNNDSKILKPALRTDVEYKSPAIDYTDCGSLLHIEDYISGLETDPKL